MLSLGLFMAAANCATEADAATILRNEYTQPTASCQGAVPAHEGKLRKRPLAIANESAETAFVSCGLTMSQGESPNGSYYVYVVLTNRGAVSATVNCTLVEGYAGFGSRYHPKSVTLEPGETDDTFAWSWADNNFMALAYPAISCALPPGVEINGVVRQFNETVS